MQSLKLTSSQKVTHYLFPLMMAALGTIFLIIFVTGWLTPLLTPFITIPAAALFLLLAIITFTKQKKALRFYSITTYNNSKTNARIIKAILKEHGWEGATITDDFIQARGHGFRHKLDLRTWAELMTFKLQGSNIKVNSICDPDAKAQFADGGKNKQNIQDFEQLFLNAPFEYGVDNS